MTAAVPAIMSISDEGKKRKGWRQLYLPFLGEKTLPQKCPRSLMLRSEWPSLMAREMLQRNWKSGEKDVHNWLRPIMVHSLGLSHDQHKQGFLMIKRKRAIAMRIPYHPKTVKVPHNVYDTFRI